MNGKKITGVWMDELSDTPFNHRYNWCLENLGPGLEYPPRWQMGEIGSPLKFRFRDPADEVWFKLRWGS